MQVPAPRLPPSHVSTLTSIVLRRFTCVSGLQRGEGRDSSALYAHMWKRWCAHEGNRSAQGHICGREHIRFESQSGYLG